MDNSIAYLTQKKMAQLKINSGDTILISKDGGRPTVCSAMYTNVENDYLKDY